MPTATRFLILTLCCYRITRLLLIDTLFEGTRTRLHTRLTRDGKGGRPPGLLRMKLFELSSCTWCAGVYVSAAVICVFYRSYPWQLGIDGWITTAAVAAGQGLLHAWEPAE